MKICLTGGIACGKSLLSRYLNELGVATVDADDIVHELIPDPAERRRLAAEVFADPVRRQALEARLHPLVRARINRILDAPGPRMVIAVIPLLFEVHWEADYDIICCVASTRENQLARMMTTRGYTRAEAEARLAAQMPVAVKAEKSHYVIRNDGTAEELRKAAARFVAWLKTQPSHDPNS
ncbi:MAG: dephospho-CoA kinase [Kiritimatiellia bacterium]